MPDPVTRLNAALEGRYHLERELGEGGMATVYLAADLKHERKVALKVLKPELAAIVGAERFLAEIKTTANLQHPHILPLFDSGEADSFLFYAMPYVEGETLRERIDRERQLPVSEALSITTAVAGALQHAHDRGVIHRDIKPANILLQGGQPVVSDFGIALAVGSAGGARLTETGLSVGTPYYMSPEQATGDQQVGPASDTFALAAVLYEMLTGEPPYSGRTAQAVLGRILQGVPVSATELRKAVPANVDSAIRKALERLPADRFTGAQDFARALADPGFRHGEASAGGVAGLQRSGQLTLPLAATTLLFALLAAWGWLRTGSQAALATYDIGVPDTVPLLTNRDARAFTVSPTGDFLVYTAKRGASSELWYRSLTSDEARPVPGTVGASGSPMISPDGRRVVFLVGAELKLASIDGGTVTIVGEETGVSFALGTDGEIAFISDGGETGSRYMQLDPVSGGLGEPTPIGYCINPQRLPDARRLLCGGGGAKSGYTVDLGASAADSVSPYTPLVPTGSAGATRSPSGVRGSDFRLIDGEYVLYVSLAGELRAAPIDVEENRIGRAITAVSRVRTESLSGSGQYQVTADGALYYIPGLHAQVGRLVRASPDGEVTPLPIDPAAFLRYDPSPDGRRLAAAVEGIGGQELRIYDLDTGQFRVWIESGWVGFPLWAPDSDRLLVDVGDRVGGSITVLLGSPVSTAPPDTVARGLPLFWGSDYYADSLILGWTGAVESRLDVRSQPARLDDVGAPALFGSISPDGRWLIHTWESGGLVEPWPSRERVYPLGETALPVWVSANEIVSLGEAGWYRTRIDPTADPPLGPPALWFSDPLLNVAPGSPHVATPDGGLLYMQRLGPDTAHYIRVIPNWVEQMKRAVDEANR